MVDGVMRSLALPMANTALRAVPAVPELLLLAALAALVAEAPERVMALFKRFGASRCCPPAHAAARSTWP